MPQRWVVVGGGDKGGIVVRAGRPLSSEQLPDRLNTGAEVEQVALEGDRLWYRLLTTFAGAGPPEGWVSLKVQGKEIVQRCEPALQQPISDPARLAIACSELLLAQFRAGALDGLIKDFHTLMRAEPNGPKVQGDPLSSHARATGFGWPWTGGSVPDKVPGGTPRVVFAGDSISHGAPHIGSAPWIPALAKSNPHLAIENCGWGGNTSMSLLRPRDFDVAMPEVRELGGDLVFIFIGANDSIQICSDEKVVDMLYCSPHQDDSRATRLPKDWRTRCPPSTALYEKSLGQLVSECRATGARVAICTPPLLGEDLSDAKGSDLRASPFIAATELAAAARRVAAAEECPVIPLQECMIHRLTLLNKPNPLKFEPMVFVTMMAMCGMQMGKQPCPWEDMLAPKKRGALQCDLVHFNEPGAAILAALCQCWLDAVA